MTHAPFFNITAFSFFRPIILEYHITSGSIIRLSILQTRYIFIQFIFQISRRRMHLFKKYDFPRYKHKETRSMRGKLEQFFLDTRVQHSPAKRAFQERSNTIESLESRISLAHRDAEVVSEKKRKEYFCRPILTIVQEKQASLEKRYLIFTHSLLVMS